MSSSNELQYCVLSVGVASGRDAALAPLLHVKCDAREQQHTRQRERGALMPRETPETQQTEQQKRREEPCNESAILTQTSDSQTQTLCLHAFNSQL